MAVNNDPCFNCPQEPTCYYPCKEWIKFWCKKERQEKKNGGKN